MSTTNWDPQAQYRDPMMMSKANQRWTPPPEVTDHHGNPIPPNWDFFAVPPTNIGQLQTAASSLEFGEEPMNPTTRMIIAIVSAAVVGGIGMMIGFIMEAVPPWVPFAIGIPLAALAFWLAYVFTSFDHTCTFVGTEGIASIACSGSREDLLPPETFRYEQAAEVRNPITHRYKNGIYQGTSYSFCWSDAAGNTVYSIDGGHHYEFNLPPANDLYCYGASAEIAWTNYVFARAIQQIQQTGFYQFNVSGSGYVRVGQGFIEFNLDGTPQRLRSEEIAFANLEAGTLTIKRHGATEGWLWSEGVFTFDYGSLGNAQLFFMLFQNLVFKM